MNPAKSASIAELARALYAAQADAIIACDRMSAAERAALDLYPDEPLAADTRARDKWRRQCCAIDKAVGAVAADAAAGSALNHCDKLADRIIREKAETIADVTNKLAAIMHRFGLGDSSPEERQAFDRVLADLRRLAVH